jgi:hypothetical protein
MSLPPPTSSTHTQYADLIYQRKIIQSNIQNLRRNIAIIDHSLQKTKHKDFSIKLNTKKRELMTKEKQLIKQRLFLDKASHDMIYGNKSNISEI